VYRSLQAPAHICVNDTSPQQKSVSFHLCFLAPSILVSFSFSLSLDCSRSLFSLSFAPSPSPAPATVRSSSIVLYILSFLHFVTTLQRSPIFLTAPLPASPLPPHINMQVAYTEDSLSMLKRFSSSGASTSHKASSAKSMSENPSVLGKRSQSGASPSGWAFLNGLDVR